MTHLADTTVDPSYFFQVHQVPFAGTLPLMVNHFRATTTARAFYRVKVDGVVHTDTWTDENWNGFNYVAVPTPTQTVGGSPGWYPVRPIDELFLWMNPSLGDLLSTAGLSNGTAHDRARVRQRRRDRRSRRATPLTIRIDNNYCTRDVSGTSAGARKRGRPRLRAPALRDKEHGPREHAVQRRPPERVRDVLVHARQGRATRHAACRAADERTGERWPCRRSRRRSQPDGQVRHRGLRRVGLRRGLGDERLGTPEPVRRLGGGRVSVLAP